MVFFAIEDGALGVIQVIFGILCIPIVIYLFRIVFGYIFGGMAKISNKKIYVNGINVGNPDTIENLNEHLKDNGRVILAILKKIKTKTGETVNTFKQHKIEVIITDHSKDKIAKIKELDSLLKANVITNEEFEIIKREIIVG